MNLFQFRTAIAGLDEATLRSFNSVLVAQINASTRLKTAVAAAAFKRGDLASFLDKGGVKRTMRVERINAKSVRARTPPRACSGACRPGS